MASATKAERGYGPHARMLRRMARDLLEAAPMLKNELLRRAARERAKELVRHARMMDRGREAVLMEVKRDGTVRARGRTRKPPRSIA
ncbi:MAG: hypothetical protein GF393_01590 [Armatimonadia bacterium]|nr:hypothetical protein [Armatimonadia bacterium]